MTADNPTPNQDELRKKLAAIEHERWADWQNWMYSVLSRSGELTEGIDEILQRWQKQAKTPYSKLTDKEKASDMEQVDRYWPLIEKLLSTEQQQARIDGMEQAKSRVLRRTEIPKDAREPTRDAIVILGEEIADIIQRDIATLQSEGNDMVATDKEPK